MMSIWKYSGPNLARRDGFARAVLQISREPELWGAGPKPRPTRARKSSRKPLPPQSGTKKLVRDKSADFAGLCVDCQNRKTCIYAKARGGVWHCEEYR